MNPKTITRMELYDKVWELPMSRLAKTYGLSDVGLAKICRKHNIPRPPRGYWAQIEVGKAPARTPLPQTDKNCSIELRDRSDGYLTSSALNEKEQPAIEVSQQVARIIVPETLRGCHQLVSRANQELQGAKLDQEGLTAIENPALEIRVAKCRLRRALLIMDAALKALEQRGYAVEKGPKVTIRGESLRFGMEEQVEVERAEPEEHDLVGPYTFGHSRFIHKRRPSGRLALHIHEAHTYWANGCRRTWRDGAKQRVEDRLNNFVASLIELAARLHHHREEQKRQEKERRDAERQREEAARRRAEKLAMQKKERDRVNALIQQVESWKTSQLLRDFIEEAKRQIAPEAMTSEPADSEFVGWVEWATQQADRLDPFRKSPPSILDEKIEETPQPAWHNSRYNP